MDSENIALVAYALLEIAKPSTVGNAIWITKPDMRDIACARTLLYNTIHEAERADAQEIERLLCETLERNTGIERWLEGLLGTYQGYRKLKGFLWLSNQYRSWPDAAH